MRSPTIHISRESLVQIFSELEIPIGDKLQRFMELSTKHRVKGRFAIYPKTKQLSNKLIKSHKSDIQNIEVFNQILDSTRMEAGHKHIPKLEKGTSNYNLMKEICLIATEFCDSFELTTREGFYIFCKIGIVTMGKKYALNKFKYYKDHIFKQKEVEELCKDEAEKDLIEILIHEYKTKLEKLGVYYKVEDVIEYSEFIYAKDELKSQGSNPKDWITSQFDQMEFLNVVPNPNQLHGQNSVKRFQQWKIKNTDNQSKQKVNPEGYDPTEFTKKFKQ